MRYSVVLLVLSLGVLLTGFSAPARTTGLTSSKAKASEKNEEVHEDGALTKRELGIIEKDLNSLDYYGFLLSDYDEPKYIDWDEVFYNGAGLKEARWTKAIEEAYLKKTGNREVIADLTILAASDVEDYVRKTTGLSYSRMRNPLDWVYLNSSDVYVFEHGDTNQIEVTVKSGYVQDGVYTVRYEHNNWWGENADCEYEVSFTKDGAAYCFISNLPDLETKGAGEYIFPESNTRNLTNADIAGLDAETLRIGRNEIYARHGRKFKDSALQSYFNGKTWYRPTGASDSEIEKSLNQYEKNNIKFIQAGESKAPASGTKTQAAGGSGTKKIASGYTNAELCKMAQDYYQKHNNYRPPIAEVDSTEGDEVTIHLYENVGNHTATSAWYVINRKTGKGYDDIFGDAIDLTK
ncbi:MAG: YARHG domain-containing protein [Lachnospiraceae bacterium]|nr:YARHG domain-containing protein [Lachnospiraceae bacterium]